MKIATVGLDLTKNVSQLHGVELHGQLVSHKQLRRTEVLRYFAKLELCVVGKEACGSTHYSGRELAKLRHTACLTTPQFVLTGQTVKVAFADQLYTGEEPAHLTKGTSFR